MECPECACATGQPQKVRMKEFLMGYRCPKCGYEIRKSQQAVALSERDVARVLQAVAAVEGWAIGRGSTSNHTRVGIPRWDTTPEGWPVPSRKLMEEIKKLL